MYPKLFEIPGLGWPINSYGFMIMIGFLMATWMGIRRGRALGLKSDVILDIGIISMIFGIIGAKVNYVIQYTHGADGNTVFRSATTPNTDLRLFDFGDGGLNWLGALALGWIPFFFWYWRTKDEKELKLYSWQNGVLLVLTLLFALVGTRALHLFLNRKDPDYDWRIFTGWQSGFVLYGGLITAVLAGALYTKMRRESIARVADLSGPLILIGLAFGRLGCFLNGCCFGGLYDGFCAVRFPPGSAPYDHYQKLQQAGTLKEHQTVLFPKDATYASVLPTQLMEAIVVLGLFFLLSWYDRKKKRNAGETMLLVAMAYAVWRFIVEFLRDDDRPRWLGDLTYSQTLGLVVFIVCAIWFYFVRTSKKSEPQEKLASEATPLPKRS